MKIYKSAILAAVALTLSATSCDSYLDKEVDLTLQSEMVFGDFDMTRGALAKLYEYLPDAFQGYSDTQFRLSQDCMTDNAIDFWGVARYHSVLDDAYDATSHWFSSHYWNQDYKGIRACNQFIANAKESVVGNAEKKGDDNRLYDRWIAEARVIRALLHFELIGYFGDIPIVADDENGNPIILSPGMTIPERTKAADALQWVADEMDKYKDNLPFRYQNEDENWGRINGAAAYALKSRALLYKASPLHNTGGDKSQWEAAAKAATDFIAKNATCTNPYRLHTTATNDPEQNYYAVFTSNPVMSNEYILSRSVWTTLNLVYFNGPCGFSGAISNTGYCNPTQNLVDAYETKNGLPIDEDPTYNPQDPYANRDPRLAQTIFHHDMVWGDGDEARPLDMNHVSDDQGQGVDYARGNGGTCTGYYCKKYVHNIRFDGTIGNQRVACPIFRFGEILLNAAEALNEAGQTSEAIKYIDQLRARVGMPSYAGKNQEQLRERLQNERRIELCFEDHRFYDCRRWKLFEKQTLDSEKNLPYYKQIYHLYGVTIHKSDATKFVYGESEKYSRQTFTAPKNYFFPIPFSEVQRIGLTQTPGWEL